MLEVKFAASDPHVDEVLLGIETKFRDRENQIYSLLSRIVLEGQRKALHYRAMSSALLMECLLSMNRLCLNIPCLFMNRVLFISSGKVHFLASLSY